MFVDLQGFIVGKKFVLKEVVLKDIDKKRILL